MSFEILKCANTGHYAGINIPQCNAVEDNVHSVHLNTSPVKQAHVYGKGLMVNTFDKCTSEAHL